MGFLACCSLHSGMPWTESQSDIHNPWWRASGLSSASYGGWVANQLYLSAWIWLQWISGVHNLGCLAYLVVLNSPASVQSVKQPESAEIDVINCYWGWIFMVHERCAFGRPPGKERIVSISLGHQHWYVFTVWRFPQSLVYMLVVDTFGVISAL
jgi:hypothetical protein